MEKEISIVFGLEPPPSYSSIVEHDVQTKGRVSNVPQVLQNNQQSSMLSSSFASLGISSSPTISSTSPTFSIIQQQQQQQQQSRQSSIAAENSIISLPNLLDAFLTCSIDVSTLERSLSLASGFYDWAEIQIPTLREKQRAFANRRSVQFSQTLGKWHDTWTQSVNHISEHRVWRAPRVDSVFDSANSQHTLEAKLAYLKSLRPK
jgi:hypothetical protein